jgi:hypothetical protein
VISNLDIVLRNSDNNKILNKNRIENKKEE